MKPRYLGDPHLGRQFKKGVPLARRGERERLMRRDLERQLVVSRDTTTHICMGDLFDKPQVSYADLQHAYTAYRAAARRAWWCTFYILQGNHDDSRDLDEVTAWDIFCDNVESVENIITVTDPLVVPGMVFLPWHPVKTAVEQLHSVLPELERTTVTRAYGHWDVDPRSQPHNLIPTAELAALGILEAYTGHIHKPDAFMRDRVAVFVIGSMQPYAQGEDGGQCDDVRYVTLSLEDALVSRDILTGACVRLQLRPGEAWEGEIPDCRSWDVQRLQPDQIAAMEDDDAPAPTMEGFNTHSVYNKVMDDYNIVSEVRAEIDDRWKETFTA